MHCGSIKVFTEELKSILIGFKNFASRCEIVDSLLGNSSDLVDVLRRIHVSSWIVIPLLFLILRICIPIFWLGDATKGVIYDI